MEIWVFRDSDNFQYDLSDREGKYIGGLNVLDVEFATLMQFTGLTDKNGKEIYEGDIVWWFADSMNKDGVVEQSPRSGWQVRRVGVEIPITPYQMQSFIPVEDNGTTDLEVIGNKWESPELLK